MPNLEIRGKIEFSSPHRVDCFMTHSSLRLFVARIFRLPLLPILLAPFILMAPVYLRGQAMFWGTPALQFVPWWHWAWETLRAGHLPLWNPLVGMGAPLLANYQSALFYPPTWIYFLLDGLGGVSWLAWGQAVLVALHLAWAGVGMALLARRLRLSVLAQTVSGLAFGLSSYLVSRSGFLSINAAGAWVPWIILGVTPLFGVVPSERLGDTEHASTNRKPGFLFSSLFTAYRNHPLHFLALVLCLAMQLLAGHAQTSWYTWLLAFLWAGFWGWCQGDGMQPIAAGGNFSNRLQGLLASWLRLGFALLLAIGLASVQLLPTGEYLLQSQRSSAVEFTFALQYSAWPWRFLSLLAPNLFGNPAQGDYWGYANFWEDALYFGLLPLLLALSALLNGLKRKSNSSSLVEEQNGVLNDSQVEMEAAKTKFPIRDLVYTGLVRFLFVLVLVSILLALGKNTPVYPWLYHYIPTFSMFQAPARWLLWTEFSLTLLAGIGADIWKRPEKRSLYWTRLATAGALAVSLGAGLTWYFLGNVSPTFIRATTLAGVWGIVAGGLSLTMVKPGAEMHSKFPGKSGFWAGGVVFFIMADLLFAGWGLNPGTNGNLYREPSPLAAQVRKLAVNGRIYLPPSDEQEIKFKRFFRFDTFYPGVDWEGMRAALLPNLNMLDGISSVNNFDPLVPGRYARWMEALKDANPEKRSSLLGLMGVSSIESADSQAPYGVRFDPLAGSGSERMRWVPCAQYAQDEQDAWRQVWNGNVDFGEKIILEGQGSDTNLSPSTCQDSGNDARISVLDKTPNRLVIKLTSSSPGWFLISDVWYPGWNAWVDGKPVPLLKADYLFRAIQVDKGEHQIIMAYQPKSFWFGLVISLIVGFLLAGYAFRILFAQRKSGHPTAR